MTVVASQLVSRETRWQMPPPKPLKPGEGVARIGLARWGRKVAGAPFEMSADEASDAHFITYSLSRSISPAVKARPALLIVAAAFRESGRCA